MTYGVSQKSAHPKLTQTPDQIKAQEQALIAWVEEQVAADKQKLLQKFPFTGNVMCRLDVLVGHWDDVETACTDGDRIWVDVLFYVKLDPEERLFVLAHECWHVIMRHFLRKMNRNSELWNWATDLEIHFLLTKEGLKAPFVLPHDPSWKDLSVEEIYEKLLKKAKQSCGQGKSDKNGDGKGKRQTAIGEVPDEWNQGKDSKTLKGSQEGKGFDGHGKKNKDPDDGEDDPKEVEDRIAGKVKAAADFVKKRNRGTLPWHLQNIVDSLPKPEIPWQQLLRQFITQSIGGNRRWLPPNRRYVWRGLYVQSTRQPVFRGVVALDTSGSCCEDAPKFFSELVGLLNSFGKYDLTVLQCDAKIQNVEHYTDEINPPSNKQWRMHGGGGTSHFPVFKWIDENCQEPPNCVICLTDGYTDIPKRQPPYPVLWVLTEDGIEQPWGSNIRFKGDSRDD